MIFISGTKRSGTSMWMQVMQAAGIPILGAAFPRNWENTLKSANPDGFYESLLRQGVYYRTNPHPKTGEYFLPEDVEGYAVKVFIPGVVRSERSYISHLVANVREWREYEASLMRLYAMEDEQRRPEAPAPVRFPPALEWWMENFALVRDLSLRKYPFRLRTYDQVISNPEQVIGETLEWIGTGDAEAAAAAVKPSNRTQERPESDSVEPSLARVFDDLYAAVEEGKGFSGNFLKTLNETNKRMLPRLMEIQRRVAEAMPKFRGSPEAVAGMPKVGA